MKRDSERGLVQLRGQAPEGNRWGGRERLVPLERQKDRYERTNLLDVRFVPLVPD